MACAQMLYRHWRVNAVTYARAFYTLMPSSSYSPLTDVPDYDGLRNDFKRLRESVTKLKSKGPAGNLHATIGRVRFNTLELIARNGWDIYGKLLEFRKSKYL